jgi:CheY-like chemotaxis protein
MTDPRRPTPDEVMAVATADFLASARAAVAGFGAVGEALAVRPDDADALTGFRRDLHRLNGSAGTFGYARAGRMAAAMEAVVKRWLETPELDRDRRSTLVTAFSSGISAELDGSGRPGAVARRLYIVGARDAVAVGLTAEAALRGYAVERVDPRDIDDALEDGPPFAMIAVAPAPAHPLLRSTVILELGGVPRADGTVGLALDAAPSDVLDALAAAAREAPAAAGSVLILDDDPVLRTIVGVAAAQVKLGAVAVADRAAFLAALEHGAPSVIVLDVEVGAENGIDIVREVRAQPHLVRVPILMLSGHDDAATRAAAKSAGASDFLLKPVSVPVLAAKLAAWSSADG